MNYKRKKPRRQVRCTMCTDGRIGNSKKGGTSRHPKRQSDSRSVRRRIGWEGTD